ncbi:uncharacterized protein CMC5_014300 [Chondromyces crocatus]|uniref:Uncharacterized protein n=2 Tax=Chondromyces crocatus TaxID=52 RepID=A0A0K1E8W5_CHOCO|nr:uncharacterized protein CMC5_014300 [Chondromyces crocatus]
MVCGAALCSAAVALPVGCTMLLGVDGEYTPVPGGEGGMGLGGSVEGGGGGGDGGGVSPCGDTRSDPQNCGACGRVCTCGACVEGECEPMRVVATRPSRIERPRLYLEHLYWVESGPEGDCIMRAPARDAQTTTPQKHGCSSEPIVDIDLWGDMLHIAGNASIKRTPVDSPANLDALQGFTVEASIREMAVRHGFAYWAASQHNYLRRRRTDGTNYSQINTGGVPEHIDAIETDSTVWVAWRRMGLVYLGQFHDGLDPVPEQESTSELPGLKLAFMQFVESPDLRLFWTTRGPDRVWAYSPGGNEGVAITGPGVKSGPGSINADQTHVYWSHRGGQREISRARMDVLDTAEVVYADKTMTMEPGEILLDQGECVYWVDSSKQEILRYAKTPQVPAE